MIKDTIYCSGCNKEIDLYEDTKIIKNRNWDLICSATKCGTWLGGMKDLLGWSIDEKEDIKRPESVNKTMER